MKPMKEHFLRQSFSCRSTSDKELILSTSFSTTFYLNGQYEVGFQSSFSVPNKPTSDSVEWLPPVSCNVHKSTSSLACIKESISIKVSAYHSNHDHIAALRVRTIEAFWFETTHFLFVCILFIGRSCGLDRLIS